MFGIDDIVTAGAALVTTIANKVAPDANIELQGKINAALFELQKHYEYQLLELSQRAKQIDVNEQEAKSPSLFVSGWRPFVGWACGASLVYVALLEPILRFSAHVIFGYTGSFPDIDTDLTLQVLLGILGLGGLRSYEKINNVARQ